MALDANTLAAEHSRREKAEASEHTAIMNPNRPQPRFGRLVGAVMTEDLENPTVDADGQVMWDDVSVLPMGDGMLMAEARDGLRTIINVRAYLFLEFRPNDDAGE